MGLVVFGMLVAEQLVDPWVILISALLYFVVGILFTKNYFQKLEEQISSSEYELGEDYIIFRQMHRPDLRISREEISRISENNGLRFHTNNLFKSIFIPDNIIGYSEIKVKVRNLDPKEKTYLNWRNQLIAPVLIIIFGIIVTFSLIKVAPEFWEGTLIAMSIITFEGLFAWIDRKRVNLTSRKKLVKILFHFFFILAIAYILFDGVVAHMPLY